MNAISEISGVGSGYVHHAALALNTGGIVYGELTDEALMDRVVKEDQDAFSTLMARHMRRITALAAKIVNRGGEAEDAAQEAFINVWRYKDTWLNWRSSFTTWVYRITVHKCYDLNKKACFYGLEEGQEPVSTAWDAFSQLHAMQFSSHIKQAIANLSEGQRVVVMLHYHEGLTAQECADVLNMKLSAVEGLLKRARQKIRETLGKAGVLADRVDDPNQISLAG